MQSHLWWTDPGAGVLGGWAGRQVDWSFLRRPERFARFCR